MSRSKRSRSGLSLVELLVVVAIISLLASIGLPLQELVRKRNAEDELRRSLRDIRTAIDGYKRLVDQGNIARSADASGYPPSLEVLVNGVQDAQAARGQMIYLMRRLPRDPMALMPSTMPPAATWGLRSYASPPDLPEAGSDVFDVHSLSEGVGLNGVPYSTW
jgi:general secretion pathway protein G